MSLNEDYFNETGLHSHYYRKVAGIKLKMELSYTRKYVWWLEEIVKRKENQIMELIERLKKKQMDRK